jgi:hypothetical protein
MKANVNSQRIHFENVSPRQYIFPLPWFVIHADKIYTFLQGLTGRAFERAKEVDEKCRAEHQVDRGE